MILAVTTDGTGIICSNIGPEASRDMGELLIDAAKQAAQRKPDNEPLN